jgi:lipid A 3-O-deacylase
MRGQTGRCLAVAALLGAPLLAAAPRAWAQTSQPAATASAPVVRLASPESDEGGLTPDPTGIWTIQGENASISTAKLTDRYYVNGLRLGYTSGTESAPEFLRGMGHTLWGDGQLRWNFDITQQIFTPADTEAHNPPPDDRPYAGVLLGNFGVVQDDRNTRNTLTLSLGVVGPDSLAQTVQNGFHTLIGQAHTNGWSHQIKNEPVFEITSSRTWRFPTGSVFGMETDVLPDVTIGLGTVRVYGLAGAQFRIGQGLDSDYGAARLEPGLSGTDVFRPTRPFVWYAFAGVDGQAVGWDITLNGNTWQNSRSVDLIPYVGEIQAGVAVIVHGMRFTYTQVFQTAEFEHQKDGLHQFGSLALSVRF